MEYFRKVIRIYNSAAVFFFNLIVFVISINIILFLIYAVKDNLYITQKSNPVSSTFSPSSLKKAYPQLSEEVISKLLDETWSRPYIYEPFTLFKERPFRGDYVNVDNNGFRLSKNQGPWPPKANFFNIFLFGGSTTFGYGLPDDQTIASHLQVFLSAKLTKDVRVYNFGMGSYYSLQERILFEKLIISGHIPDMAIFIDGFNDFYLLEGEPAFSDRFEAVLNNNSISSKNSIESKILNKLPMTRLAKYLGQKYFVQKSNITISHEPDMYAKNDNKELNSDQDADYQKSKFTKVINNYLENKKIIEAIADAYDVTPFFVWQPISSYKYDVRYHLFASSSQLDNYLKFGYKNMEDHIKKIPFDNNFLWAANIQENSQLPLYVDKVHYSAEMSKILAGYIGNQLFSRHFLIED